jgi:hypothetical protein
VERTSQGLQLAVARDGVAPQVFPLADGATAQVDFGR